MRQGSITAAYKTIMNLYRFKGIPFQISVDLLKRKRELQVYVDCQTEQEERVAAEIAGCINEDGSYPMDEEKQARFRRELAKIQEVDVNYDLEPITIKLTPKLVEVMGISGEIMDVLDGFISFEMEEDGEAG